IDPSSIKSMEVLKGPAAASIYGAQAGNGVILITTKQGSEETEVNFSIERGVTQRIKNVEYWDRDQLIEYRMASIAYDNGLPTTMQGLRDAGMYDAVLNNYKQNYLPRLGLDPASDVSELPNTDWYNLLSRTGVSEKYRMSILGGSEMSRWRMSGSYENTDGFLKRNYYKNYRLQGRFNQKLSDKIAFRMNINLSRQKFLGPCQGGFYINCPMSAASFITPLTRPYLEDGSYSHDFPFLGGSNNPFIQLYERDRANKLIYVLGSLQAQYNITDWLLFKATAALDYHQETNKYYENSIASPGDGGNISRYLQQVTNSQYSGVFNFQHVFNEDHEISGIAGVEYRREYSKGFSGGGQGLPN